MARLALPKATMLVTLLVAVNCTAADQPIVVPIRVAANAAFVTVNIAGEHVALIFDSGNSGSISLSQTVIDRVKARPTGEFSRGIDPKGNVLKYPKFRVSRVQLGTAVFTDVIAELDVHDPSYEANQVGQQGFLGTELLKRYKVVLDYRHRRITLVPSGSSMAASAGCRGTAVPFSPVWHGEPAAEADIDLGRLTLWWVTGAPTSVLSKRFTEARSQEPGNTVTSNRLKLGGADFGPLQFAVEDLSLPAGFDGAIGYNFFDHHVVCMDFPGSRLLIQR